MIPEVIPEVIPEGVIPERFPVIPGSSFMQVRPDSRLIPTLESDTMTS